MKRYLYAFFCGLLLAGTIAGLSMITKKPVKTQENYFDSKLVIADETGASLVMFAADGRVGVIDYGAASVDRLFSWLSDRKAESIDYYICASDTFDYKNTILELNKKYAINTIYVNAVNPTAFSQTAALRVTEPISFSEKNFELLLACADSNVKKEVGDCAIIAALQFYGTSFLIADGLTQSRMQEMERYESRAFSCVVLTNSGVGEKEKKGFLDRFYPNILVTEVMEESTEIPCFSPENGVISFYISENGASVVQ